MTTGRTARTGSRFGITACALALIFSLFTMGTAAAQQLQTDTKTGDISAALGAGGESKAPENLDTYFYRVESYIQLNPGSGGLQSDQVYAPHEIPPAGQQIWDFQSVNLQGDGPDRAFARTYARLNADLRSGWLYHQHIGETAWGDYARTHSTISLDLNPTQPMKVTVDVQRHTKADGETFVAIRNGQGDLVSSGVIASGTMEVEIPAGEFVRMHIGSSQWVNGTGMEIGDSAVVNWAIELECFVNGGWVC